MGVIDYSQYLKEILSQPAPEEERYECSVYRVIWSALIVCHDSIAGIYTSRVGSV